MAALDDDSEQVVVLAPLGRDAVAIAAELDQRGLASKLLGSVHDLLEAVRGGAGAAVVTSEAFGPATLAELGAVLAAQPAWSDFPLIVLSTREADRALTHALLEVGNVTLLERPIAGETLLAAVGSALRGRRRQYAARRAITQREQFLAMLGHELRNPLGAVIFASDLLERSADPNETQRYRAIIGRQARHLARLVDDLLEVSRVTSGKLTLKLQPVELTEAVRKALQALDEQIRKRRHRLSVRTGQPLWVNGDPVRLEQVFSNLIGNAIKYTPPGGDIEVEVGAGDGSAQVRVRDSGVGIEPAMLARVFEPFAQLRSTLDRAEGGMGLGLAVVRGLVDRQGGTVEASSAGPGKGSTFTVRLPLIDPPRAAAAAAEGAHVADAPLRLVLVEDSPDICEALGDLLRVEGHDVQIAHDGPEGIELIERSHPDLALIDIGLPGLNGYQVARQVRSDMGQEVRLVALTGYGQPEDTRRALDAGFDLHLKKPIDLQALSRLLHDVSIAR